MPSEFPPKAVDEEEVCTTWGDDDQALDAPLVKQDSPSGAVSASGDDAAPAGDSRESTWSLVVSFATLILSIPALIGAWCWPALLVAAVSGSVSAAARTMGHYISLGLTAGLMSVVLGFTIHTRRNRIKMKTFCARNGPLLLVMTAIPLILADIIRHVLQDEGYWPACIAAPGGGCEWYSSAEYKAGEAETVTDENLTHLSTIGILFTIVCTYSGFILLAVGTLWNANIMSKMGKIKKQWAILRAKARGQASGGKGSSSGAGREGGSIYVQVDNVA